MWKYFFLGLLVGWLLEWIIDWFYWRRGTDDGAPPEGSRGVADHAAQAPGSRREAAARVAMAAEPSGARMPAVPLQDLQPGVPPQAAGEAETGSAPEPNAGESTSAGTSAGRVGTDAAMGAAGAVSTTSATLTSRAPVYRQEDLEAVVGIGPKVGAMLRNNGITTFSELTAVSTWELERIVESTGEEPGEAAVDTWAIQARLAAVQDWEGLARLQGELQSRGAAARRED
jgi:predicted flap endonuclease-1-like 5' DNA nuclease